jgi:hypothetical protein
VLPVNYSVDVGAILIATSPFGMLARFASKGEVSLEVDHADEETGSGWSVLLHSLPHGRQPGLAPDDHHGVVLADVLPGDQREPLGAGRRQQTRGDGLVDPALRLADLSPWTALCPTQPPVSALMMLSVTMNWPRVATSHQ